MADSVNGSSSSSDSCNPMQASGEEASDGGHAESNPETRLPTEDICYKRAVFKRARNGNRVAANPEYGLGLHFDQIRSHRIDHLRRVLGSLSSKQREHVQAIGFGGILEFKCDRLPVQMNDWLIERFNPVSRNFEVDKIVFALSGLDASRVFGLNYSPGSPVVCSGQDDEDTPFITSWKRRYCQDGRDDIEFYDVVSLLNRLRNGGDDFKRLFVLYVMHGLLTPEFGTNLELGLLKSVRHVEGIKNLNWAGHVVDHLCDSLSVYRQRRSARGCEGCLLLLQVVYFHSCMWKGEVPPIEEPLIKHWYGTKIEERVLDEDASGGFGKGWFLENNQRRSLQYLSPLSRPVTNSSNAARNRDLPISIWGDDDISQAIEDEGSRKTWILLRNVETLIESHVESKMLHGFELRDSCFTDHRNDKVLFDARGGLDRVMVNLFSCCWYLNPGSTIRIGNIVEESLGVVDPFGEAAFSSPVQGSPWNAWVFNYPPLYSSLVLQKCCTISHQFLPFKLEVADYCISHGTAVNSESLFSDGGETWIRRAQFTSMEAGEVVHPRVVTAFARLLNYDWSTQGTTSRVCFGVLQFGDESLNHSTSTIVKEWRGWINVCKLNVHQAAFVLIPVKMRSNYYLVVINFMDSKIQCIEITRPGDCDVLCERRTRLIGASFAILLDYLRDERAAEVGAFSCQRITPHWSSSVTDPDRGVCVMNMLERFCGSAFAIEQLRLNEEHKLLQLRVAYSCYIALSIVNLRRSEVLEKIPAFIISKKGIGSHP